MTVSNGQNRRVPTTDARRCLARAMLALALAAPAILPPAGPAAAQQEATAPVPETAAAPPAAPPVPAAPAAAEAAIPPAPKPAHDLTPMGMFMAADPVVKGVMALLAAASVVVWAILLVRGLGLLVAKRRLRTAIAGFPVSLR